MIVLFFSAALAQAPPAACKECAAVVSAIQQNCKQNASPLSSSDWQKVGANMAQCVCPTMTNAQADACSSCLLTQDPTGAGTASFQVIAKDCKSSQQQAAVDLIKLFGLSIEPPAGSPETNSNSTTGGPTKKPSNSGIRASYMLAPLVLLLL